jgi:hypothetical protein
MHKIQSNPSIQFFLLLETLEGKAPTITIEVILKALREFL